MNRSAGQEAGFRLPGAGPGDQHHRLEEHGPRNRPGGDRGEGLAGEDQGAAAQCRIDTARSRGGIPRPSRPRRLRVAISGKSGCGNTTVSRLVATVLACIVINYTFKNLAQDKGMSFEEIALLAETDPQYDLTIDRMQVQLASRGRCVLGSRLAIWLLRDTAFTVYLKAPLEVRAGRIARREGKEPAMAMQETEERDKRDHDRYFRLYGYDVNNYEFAALVVDAAALGQDEVAREIVQHAAKFRGAQSGNTPPPGTPPPGA